MIGLESHAQCGCHIRRGTPGSALQSTGPDNRPDPQLTQEPPQPVRHTNTKLDKKMLCYCTESTIHPGRGMPSNAWLSTSPDSRCCPQPNLTLS